MTKKDSQPLILANWKMNLQVSESVSLTRSLSKSLIKQLSQAVLVLCPTFPALSSVAGVIKRKNIFLGAQDVFWKNSGPYTGEVSPAVLKELGVSYIIVGHSERRNYLKESDQMINHKTLACLGEGLIPVVCVGETLAERQQGAKDMAVFNQVKKALSGVELTSDQRIVLAYEPVWVIGSGHAIDGDEAEHMAQVIREALLDIFSSAVVNNQITIIYGGSVDAGNVTDFVRGHLLAGVLVGGAALRPVQLTAIVKALIK